MRQNSRRPAQTFVPSGSFSLESRMVLSTIGPPAHPGHTPAIHVANHHASHPATPTSARWAWLENTYWYVPTKNLPATLFNSATGTLAAVSDQTVYHITGYRSGYFWGNNVTQLGSSPASSSTLVGSVTPQGKVLLTFTSTGDSSSPSITNGYGTMQRKGGGWTMENQMSTSPGSTLQIGHWAYMVQTRPGQASWNSLPGSGLSVPEFLSQGDGTAPQPVGA